MSLNAYRRTMRETATPKQVERQILLRLNKGMQEVQDQFDAGTPAKRLAILSDGLRSHLSDNLKFWLVIRADLMAPENQLPDELRANLISLSLFVESHTAGVLGGRLDLRPLIDNNQIIINALSGLAPSEPV